MAKFLSFCFWYDKKKIFWFIQVIHGRVDRHRCVTDACCVRICVPFFTTWVKLNYYSIFFNCEKNWKAWNGWSFSPQLMKKWVISIQWSRTFKSCHRKCKKVPPSQASQSGQFLSFVVTLFNFCFKGCCLGSCSDYCSVSCWGCCSVNCLGSCLGYSVCSFGCC